MKIVTGSFLFDTGDLLGQIVAIVAVSTGTCDAVSKVLGQNKGHTFLIISISNRSLEITKHIQNHIYKSAGTILHNGVVANDQIGIIVVDDVSHCCHQIGNQSSNLLAGIFTILTGNDTSAVDKYSALLLSIFYILYIDNLERTRYTLVIGVDHQDDLITEQNFHKNSICLLLDGIYHIGKAISILVYSLSRHKILENLLIVISNLIQIRVRDFLHTNSPPVNK